MKITLKCLIVFALISAIPYVYAETQGDLKTKADSAPCSISGRVIDRVRQDEPISSAKIHYIGPKFGMVITDTDGQYSVADLPAGKYTFVVSKSGYHGAMQAVEIGSGSQLSRDFHLQKTVINSAVRTSIIVNGIIVLAWIFTVVWAAWDTSKIKTLLEEKQSLIDKLPGHQKLRFKKYSSGLWSSPLLLFLVCLLIWIVFFPWYLLIRRNVKKGIAELLT